MNGSRMGNRSLKWVGIAAALAALSVLPLWFILRHKDPKLATADAPAEETHAVSCLGRIQPEDGVLHVAGPYIWGDSHAPRVESLKVREGDEVHRGQALAVFVGRANLQASVAQAQAQTAKARLRVEQIKGGARKPDLAAQQAEISRLDAETQHARAELRRYETLRATDDVTITEVEARRTALQVNEFAADAARHRLESLQQIPDTDVRQAEADLAEALANEQRTRSEFEASTIYAPADGRVLHINAHAGEEVGPSGLLDIARNTIFVLAEVYETDIEKIHAGQHVTVSGDILGATVLTGVVERVSHNVKDAAVMPGDTVSFADKRVVETLIRLEQNQPAANLIGGKVVVVIHT